MASRAAGSPSRRVPLPWAISGRPPPLPSMRGAAARTRSPAAIPRPTRSSLTVTKSCGSSASRPRAMTPDATSPRRSLAALFSASIEANGPAKATSRTPGCRLDRLADAARPVGAGPPHPSAAAGVRLAQLVLERRDPAGKAATLVAPAASAARSSVATRSARHASAPSPGERLDPAHAASRCSARR